MNHPRMFRFLVSTALLMLPAVAAAEISVQLDDTGKVKRVFVLSPRRGQNQVVWGQVRGNVPLAQILNPLGDNLGDLAPQIRYEPQSGNPWAVWPMNVANQKQIGYAFWTGSAWSVPRRIVTQPDPYFYDEINPSFVLDLSGRPYVVWERAEPAHAIYLSLTFQGAWMPPLLVSEEAVDSRRPTIELRGSSVVVTYETASGPRERLYDSVTLLGTAAKLMDTPIPPGQDKKNNDGGSTNDDGGGSKKRR